MLKKNQTADVQITGYTSEGEGVCRIDGCAVFVPNTVRGELCRVTVTHVGKNSAHGKVEKVIWRSAHRTAPDCPYAKRCGGCQLWHMDYAEELRFKAGKVKDALNRLGGQDVKALTITGADGVRYEPLLWKEDEGPRTKEDQGGSIRVLEDPEQIAPNQPLWDPDAVPADSPEIRLLSWGYRNKAQFPMEMQYNRPVAGFYERNTHWVVPIERCLIQDPIADQVKRIVLDWAERYRVSAYQEELHRGLLRHIFVRTAAVTKQVMVCLVTNGSRIPHQEELISRLQWGIPGLASLTQCVNTEKTNVILTDEIRTLYGKDYIEDELCGFTFRLSARSFYQVNHDQAQRLYEKAIEFADLHGTETVLDLYCGTGTITLALSRRVGKAIGVEIIPQAIEDAKENAVRNGVTNTEFICADAGEAAKRFAKSLPHEGKAVSPETLTDEVLPDDRPVGIDVIVVDPPRKGLSPDVIDAIVTMSPARLVYVSCDPATLARDVKLLTAQGYSLTRAEAFDLFPRTFHVETVVQLVRKNPDMTISVTVNLEDADLTAAESKGTYEQIKDYVLKTYGFQVSSLQIAQTKRFHDLPVGPNYNPSKKDAHHIPKCPPEKAAAIREALQHFKML